jgi:hypothetical protein
MADLSQTARDPRGDFVRATPRNPVLGFLSDIVGASYSPQRTQQMQGTARLFNAPAISETLNRLAYGEPLTTGAGGIGGTTRVRPEALEAGLALTDFLPSGAAAKSAAFAVPALAGIFVGPKAKTWDAIAAQKAKMLADIGTDPRTIWQQTGTWKGPDGKWRQEISDQPAKITEDVYKQISANKEFKGPMGQALQHQELYKAYPETAGIRTTMFADETPSGGMSPGISGTFQIPVITVGGPSLMTQRSTALHELQHAIQQREGFARGGSPSNMITELENIAKQKRQESQSLFRASSANDPLDPTRLVKPGARAKGLQLEKEARELEEKALLAFHSGQARFDLYRQLAGEAEARAVQKRRNMTPEQRQATFPEESYDVPINELIVRTN